MNNYFIIIFIFFYLKTDSNPTMTSNCLIKINSSYRIGIRKKLSIRIVFSGNSFFNKRYFISKHLTKSILGNISVFDFLSIDCITKIFVVSGHCFSNCTGSSSCSKKVSDSFLPCPNFCESTINRWI
ncbi:DUF1882 domain-containing protein [Chryseobacterium nematophagum]|uniref:DUF1882 domain-containing protein n=1 Tax=Chryseobacterium nematophagum TaxID=2305228 RepID=A0A3M7L9L2_9FLAO|nr:DUF1882 domain-containing protein [Chryseobacterium nematophagum]